MWSTVCDLITLSANEKPEEEFPEGFFEKPRRHATEEKGFDEKTCIPVTITYYGWICPKCGRTLSPNTAVCPCSDKWEVTC